MRKTIKMVILQLVTWGMFGIIIAFKYNRSTLRSINKSYTSETDFEVSFGSIRQTANSKFKNINRQIDEFTPITDFERYDALFSKTKYDLESMVPSVGQVLQLLPETEIIWSDCREFVQKTLKSLIDTEFLAKLGHVDLSTTNQLMNDISSQLGKMFNMQNDLSRSNLQKVFDSIGKFNYHAIPGNFKLTLQKSLNRFLTKSAEISFTRIHDLEHKLIQFNNFSFRLLKILFLVCLVGYLIASICFITKSEKMRRIAAGLFFLSSALFTISMLFSILSAGVYNSVLRIAEDPNILRDMASEQDNLVWKTFNACKEEDNFLQVWLQNIPEITTSEIKKTSNQIILDLHLHGKLIFDLAQTPKRMLKDSFAKYIDTVPDFDTVVLSRFRNELEVLLSSFHAVEEALLAFSSKFSSVKISEKLLLFKNEIEKILILQDAYRRMLSDYSKATGFDSDSFFESLKSSVQQIDRFYSNIKTLESKSQILLVHTNSIIQLAKKRIQSVSESFVPEVKKLRSSYINRVYKSVRKNLLSKDLHCRKLHQTLQAGREKILKASRSSNLLFALVSCLLLLSLALSFMFHYTPILSY